MLKRGGVKVIKFIKFLVYESFEGDLWALGLVFLESMILQASFKIYYAIDDDRSINIDSNSLA